jgi:hypothetical protein
LCSSEICNILVEYEGQIISDSEIEFDNSDSGSSHVDDIALGEVIPGETDNKVEDQRTTGFQ